MRLKLAPMGDSPLLLTDHLLAWALHLLALRRQVCTKLGVGSCIQCRVEQVPELVQAQVSQSGLYVVWHRTQAMRQHV